MTFTYPYPGSQYDPAYEPVTCTVTPCRFWKSYVPFHDVPQELRVGHNGPDYTYMVRTEWRLA